MATPQELAQEVLEYESSHPGLSRSDAVRQVLKDHGVGRLDFEEILRKVRILLFEDQQARVSISPDVEEELGPRVVIISEPPPPPAPEEGGKKKSKTPKKDTSKTSAESSEPEDEDPSVGHASRLRWWTDRYDHY